MLGAFGELYVLDWGLASTRALRESLPPADDTEKRVASGTPGYMAPEQIRGEPPDPSCDVYALGTLLYEILTLERMHKGKTSRDLCEATLAGEIDRPSQRAPDRDIAPELDVICARATALSKSHRYASARALYDDLVRYLEGDRDLSLRLTLSREHAARAESLASQAREGGAAGSDARSEALRTVSRALALDPENPEALRTLIALITSPPVETPPEATLDMQATERSLDGPRGRGGMIGLLILATVYPIVWLILGVRNVPTFALCVTVGFVAAALGFLRVRRPRQDGFAPTYLPVVVSCLIGLFALCIHPTIFTPTVAIPFAVGYTLSMDGRRRFLPMLACTAALLVPAIMEWVHLISPSSFITADHKSCMFSRMGASPQLSGFLLVFGNVICLVAACFYALQFRGVLTDTQRRVAVMSWQLRQLLPKDARPKTVPPGPRFRTTAGHAVASNDPER
jgi:eukaryotic-like serine/threonine-protein kinase